MFSLFVGEKEVFLVDPSELMLGNEHVLSHEELWGVHTVLLTKETDLSSVKLTKYRILFGTATKRQT